MYRKNQQQFFGSIGGESISPALNVGKNTLIVGIGNIIRKDDGVGVHAVHELLESVAGIPDNIEVLDGGTAGYNLLPFMLGRDRIIVVDALLADGKPGSVYRFPASLLRRDAARTVLPRFDLHELLCHVRLMGCDPDVEIIGVVPEDIESTEIGLSDSVRRSIPRIIEETMAAATHGRTGKTA